MVIEVADSRIGMGPDRVSKAVEAFAFQAYET